MRNLYASIFSALFIFICLPAMRAVADAGDGYEQPAASSDQAESAASFDKRLPPVIPGEEVKDGKKKMKVWSTAGAVAVNPEAPQPPHAPQIGSSYPIDANVGVIVDRDEDHDHKRPHH